MVIFLYSLDIFVWIKLDCLVNKVFTLDPSNHVKMRLWHTFWLKKKSALSGELGPVVQSIVSLMNSLRVISLTVLADSIYNILIFFAEKM